MLSIFDEYTIAYNDRSDMSKDPKAIERIIMKGKLLTSVSIIDGNAAGTWKRVIRKKEVEIRVSMFRKASSAEKLELEKACEEYGRFLGLQHITTIG